MLVSYINAAGQANVWEYELKAKFVAPSLEPALAGENLLILEETGEAIAVVLRKLRDAATRRYREATRLGFGGSILENVNVAVKGDDEMGDADRLEHGNVDVAADGIADAVGLVRFVRSDMEVDYVATAGASGKRGQIEARQESGCA